MYHFWSNVFTLSYSYIGSTNSHCYSRAGRSDRYLQIWQRGAVPLQWQRPEPSPLSQLVFPRTPIRKREVIERILKACIFQNWRMAVGSIKLHGVGSLRWQLRILGRVWRGIYSWKDSLKGFPIWLFSVSLNHHKSGWILLSLVWKMCDDLRSTRLKINLAKHTELWVRTFDSY